MTPEDYPGRGQLPDKLAFVAPNRSECYIALRRADDPQTAEELTATLECSQATVYRMLDDLEDIGLVTDAVRLDADTPPKAAYKTTSPEPADHPSRAYTDGGHE